MRFIYLCVKNISTMETHVYGVVKTGDSFLLNRDQSPVYQRRQFRRFYLTIILCKSDYLNYESTNSLMREHSLMRVLMIDRLTTTS